jgi:hypothetical protein
LAEVALQASVLHVLECLQGEVELALAHDEAFEDFFKVFTRILVLVAGQGVHAVESGHFLRNLLYFFFQHIEAL